MGSTTAILRHWDGRLKVHDTSIGTLTHYHGHTTATPRPPSSRRERHMLCSAGPAALYFYNRIRMYFYGY